MEFWFRYFWAIALAVNAVNLVAMSLQPGLSSNDPEEREWYADFKRRLVLVGSIPWLVMGAGSTLGGVPNMLYYFRPQDRNPWVLAWFGSMFAIWVAVSYWIFLRGGAESLAAHPQAFQPPISDPRKVKGFWLLCSAGGVLGVVLMLTMNVPVVTFG